MYRLQIKAKAKDSLGRNIFGKRWMLSLAVALVGGLIMTVFKSIGDQINYQVQIRKIVYLSQSGDYTALKQMTAGPGVATILCYILAAIVWIFVTGAIMYGLAKFFLDNSRSAEDNKFGKLFSGFTEGYGKNIGLFILSNIFIFLWTLLLIVPGIIANYAYKMVWFIRNDHPEYSVWECIKASRKMMHGHKMDYFVLKLTFIGWICIGILTCGIGMLWVAPYIGQAEVEFYESIKDNQI
ncbi:MAG: DUF975 family protein [Eubacterium sp.]|nr:DUF975 family protein [Eubacterium sp.]